MKQHNIEGGKAEEVGRVPSEPGCEASPSPASGFAESHPSRKSVSQRLPRKCKIAYECDPDNRVLHITASVETQDELDAICEAFTALRQWLASDSDRNPQGEKPQALSAEHGSAGPEGIANPLPPTP